MTEQRPCRTSGLRHRGLPEVSVEEEKPEIRKRNLEIRKREFENGNRGFETKGAVKMMKKSQRPHCCPDRVGGDATRKMDTLLFRVRHIHGLYKSEQRACWGAIRMRRWMVSRRLVRFVHR